MLTLYIIKESSIKITGRRIFRVYIFQSSPKHWMLWFLVLLEDIQGVQELNSTASMACFASNPSFVCLATASRSMSPVARWHRQYSSLMKGDCVPFPHPGGPENLNNHKLGELQHFGAPQSTMSHIVHPCPRTSGFSLCQGKEHLVPPLWICHSNETFDSKLFVKIYANKMGLWGYPKNDEVILLVKNVGEFISHSQILSYLPMLQSLLGPTSLTAFSDGEALHMVKVITRFWARTFQACSLKLTILSLPQIISTQENVRSMTISNTTNFCSNSILNTLEERRWSTGHLLFAIKSTLTILLQLWTNQAPREICQVPKEGFQNLSLQPSKFASLTDIGGTLFSVHPVAWHRHAFLQESQVFFSTAENFQTSDTCQNSLESCDCHRITCEERRLGTKAGWSQNCFSFYVIPVLLGFART